jgi:tellurite resistance protein TerC
VIAGTVREAVPWLAVAVALGAFLWVDLRFFARGREPEYREGVVWSIGWLGVALVTAGMLLAVAGAGASAGYTTVYLIERSLSLDNLFVFLLLFAYFGVPAPHRGRLLVAGIVAALAIRGITIVGGLALIERFNFIVYVLGAGLLFLSYRMLRGVGENVDPERNPLVRGVRRLLPVSDDFRGGRFLVRENGRWVATPLLLVLASLVFADVAFAIDSIPAAFAITRDPLLIWMGNAFALLGLRALFVLVEGLIRRFRYLDETLAVVIAFVAVKLLLEEVRPIGTWTSLGVIALAFAAGIAASVVADRRAPEPPAKVASRRPPRCPPALASGAPRAACVP